MKNSKGIIIFGASGLIGRYLYRRLKDQGKKVLGTCYQTKVDGLIPFNLADFSLSTIDLHGIDSAVICSAITKLDRCRENPERANRINVTGTETLLTELQNRNIFPVFFSSASVFDGVTGNYTEDDPKNPTTLYGQQKARIDDFILREIRQYLILRPGKVFGTHKDEGVLFADWLGKYLRKETIRCADDEQLSPVWAEDIARAIQILLDRGARGIYHVNPPHHFSRYDLATLFFRRRGIADAQVERCSIDDFNFTETRPRNTFLDASKFMRETGFEFTPLETIFPRITGKI